LITNEQFRSKRNRC